MEKTVITENSAINGSNEKDDYPEFADFGGMMVAE
jgi:hypothetical protein